MSTVRQTHRLVKQLLEALGQPHKWGAAAADGEEDALVAGAVMKVAETAALKTSMALQ